VVRAGGYSARARFAAPLGDVRAQEVLILAVVALLPLTSALTLRVSFPLKFYELALGLVALTALAGDRFRAAPGGWRVLRFPAMFVALASVVLALRLRVCPADSFDPGSPALRFGPAGDGAAKLLYLSLAAFGFAVCSRVAYLNPRRYSTAWVAGALLAAAYSWTLFACALGDVDPPLLPGIVKPQLIEFAGHEFVRSGTFEEGNYLGLYLVCSVAVAVHARRFASATLLSLTTLLTFSTANVVALALFWVALGLGAALRNRGTARRGAAAAGVVAAAALTLLALGATGYLTEFVYNKLAVEEVGSKLDRVDTAFAGLRMFFANPVLGVGVSQYTYNYDAFKLTGFFADGRGGVSIANDVYVELLAETGLAGTALFAIFLLLLWRDTARPRLAALRAGFLAMLVALNAFPSYSVMFLWAYWALILGAARSDEEAAARLAGRAARR
jgi:hypothetical protein